MTGDRSVVHQGSDRRGLFYTVEHDYTMDDNTTDESSPVATTESVEEDDLIVSSYVATNSEVFPKVLQLHVEDGAKIAVFLTGLVTSFLR